MTNVTTKTLADVKADMSELYEQVKAGNCDMRRANELANITGKYLKAVQLQIAQEVLEANYPSKSRALTHER